MRFFRELLDSLISIEFMLLLTVLFAFSIGFATFIENDFGSETAWAVVYGARWFEILWILLAVNLVGNIVKYKMWKPRKIPAFIFHVSFLVIFLGAALTRYAGYEGVMHIREGSSSNEIISSDAFLYIKADDGESSVEREKKVLLSVLAKSIVNRFEESIDINGKKLTVRYVDYYPFAEKKIVQAEDGKPLISAVFMTDQQPVSKILEYGDVFRSGKLIFSFGNPVQQDGYVYIYLKNQKFYIRSDKDIEYFEMKTQKTGKIPSQKDTVLETGRMYSVGGLNFVIRDVVASGKVDITPKKDSNLKVSGNKSALIVEVEYDGIKKTVKLLGGGMRANIVGEPVKLKIKDINIELRWGAKLIKLPFEIYLKDFVVEKYPGSMQPSSYESDVIVKDPVNKKEFEYKIYMNHTLEYGGYKFFQSSYDPDEKGTILSVNHDPGKIPTYIGYTLLALGLFLNLLNPYSRFGKLARLKVDKIVTGLLLLFITGYAVAEENPRNMPLEKIIQEVKKINKEHADRFGTLITQSFDGRLEPVDTLSIEVMNKISKRRSFFGLDHNQIVLGMLVLPRYWQMIPVIKVSHPAVKKILGIPMEDKYFPFYKAFDDEGNYKLYEAVELARRKKPAQRNQFDKEVLKIDERLNIMYMVFTGELFRIFPLKGDPNHTWYSPKSAVEKFPKEEAEKVRLFLVGYFASVEKGIKDGDWSLADKVLEKIREYQKINGAEIYPSETKIKLEILYNKLNIFERLIFVYLFAGFTLLGLIFAKLIKPSLNLKMPTVVAVSILVIGFLLHTFNLGLRWYLSGHAPWSNGYESMIYIAWTIVLAGIIFARQSPFAVASTGILAGITLFVAHLSWMDPQITTIVPVLKSYWLTIHVSVITASYGFLGLSALLGLISLVLFIIRNPKKQDEKQRQIEISILEATRINEMSMILGLSLLTVGNFLGGVWANESWGRYWGWDPKETWALVTILVYTAVIHTRLVPYLRSTYLFAVLSVISFFSVLMTYFGVNFYLSGLHSYAAGDPVPIPTWVYWAVGIVFLLIVLAFRNRKIKTI
ncbi:cytochrome c-type biogenesis protein CcsB [Persephonella hydrogeniphila]|uniref:Cytochrome c-type biogenesis protein CcsB n=1 Tax=Persephonella hydrogeniphila TaxID=198703 RepID=A0A285NE92_9AQUI|nr:c-type cytochrome biogenesis protein CcsB [Persephonella hydrogeniphila]SNZ07812.1 cytochrome c-type biogenesis protein CcsB [Persephonella hydrogeniphila]